eukprot:TRINITY_DN552_c1_g3_i1.p1 TRINITY_DN552_c1_g3~~TRINITY_DN552_c1_g3_i1.p1  ORF type:complete len:1297 (+),score=461.72 TRINITY_DN552_c1_g3_i1:60-3950(+)
MSCVEPDPSVSTAWLCRPKSPLFRFDVFPFIPLYALGIFGLKYDIIEYDLIKWIPMAVIVILHCGAMMCNIWSIRFKAYSQFHKETRVAKATHVCFIPPPHSGSAELVRLNKKGEWPSAVFQNLFFAYSPETDTFHHLEFPTNNVLSSYLDHVGCESETEFNGLVNKYGPNEFKIPTPPFIQLLKENLTAPFFSFQVLCSILWLMDEYWQYSIFTLFLLVAFECTTVGQRLKNFKILGSMRKPPRDLYVYRSSIWKKVCSSTLVPGDIVSLKKGSPKKEIDMNRRPKNMSVSEWQRMKKERQAEQIKFTVASGVDPKTGKPIPPKNVGEAFKRLFNPPAPVQPNKEDGKDSCPCDCLLLKGSCVVNEAMLTGEAVPQIKESVMSITSEDLNKNLEICKTNPVHRRHVVYGGTRIMLNNMEEENGNCSSDNVAVNSIPNAPDGGSLGYVLRTGFYTTQGDLMRTIIFSTEQVTANSVEVFGFLFCLLIFGLVSSGYVLRVGLADEERSQYKLILHCIMIITSVVPPELPFQLSLAVMSSIKALLKAGVYCTEPFRIPFAGKIYTCAFDKTGTITCEDFKVQNIHLADGPHTDPTTLPINSQLVLAGCNSLMVVDNKLTGDPLETAAMEFLGWKLEGSVIHPGTGHNNQAISSIRISHRFAFASELRRMTTVVRLQTGFGCDDWKNDRYYLLTKGAPEVIGDMVKDAPADYVSCYRHHGRGGFRVLAMAIKELPPQLSLSDIRAMPRQELESDMSYAGLLVMESPLKKRSKEVLARLIASSHNVVVITGDNELTSSSVCIKCGVIPKTINRDHILVLRTDSEKTKVYWEAIGENVECDPTITEFDGKSVRPATDFWAATGDAVQWLRDNDPSNFARMICQCGLFARVSPKQKEMVITALKTMGAVLMCGDGTNDVGALKQADVGISIVSVSSDEDKKVEVFEKKKQDTEEYLNKNPHLRRQPKFMREMMMDLQQDDANDIIQFGDASIASPFTAKTSSLKCVPNIIRQGRCTLVTTLQMFKVLGVNSLMLCYSLSVLHFYGVKSGDQQLTIAGMFMAVLFLLLSQARPVKRLSSLRPPTKVFSGYVALSILLQFAIHLSCMLLAMKMVEPYVDPNDASLKPDADFSPNVINTVVFIVEQVVTLNTFFINYRGRPFMKSINETKPLKIVFIAAYVLFFSSVLGFNIIDGWLQMAELPSTEFRVQLFALLAVDTILVFVIERGIILPLFGGTKNKEVAGMVAAEIEDNCDDDSDEEEEESSFLPASLAREFAKKQQPRQSTAPSTSKAPIRARRGKMHRH